MKKCCGFTLVELMIVVAIVAVLAVFAVPAYKDQADRARRADGKAFIMDIASRSERFYTQYSSYTNVIAPTGSCSGAACGLNYSANGSPDGYYSASIAMTPSGCAVGTVSPCVMYTITVTPNVSDPKCATLTLDSTGLEGSSGTASVAECWR